MQVERRSAVREPEEASLPTDKATISALTEKISKLEIGAAKLEAYRQYTLDVFTFTSGHTKLLYRVDANNKPPAYLATIVVDFIDPPLDDRDAQHLKKLQEQLKGGVGITELFNAAVEEGDLEYVRFLLRIRGIDVNARDEQSRWAPLDTAVHHSRKEVVACLLDHNANTEQPIAPTPLHRALANGDKEIAELLVTKGAITTSEHFVSKLRSVCESNREDPIAIMLKAAANTIIPIKLNRDWTRFVFGLACEPGRADVLRELINSNLITQPRLNQTTSGFRKTKLHWAAMRGDAKIVQVFLEKMADITQQDSNNKSAYELACEGDHADVVEAFINSKRVDINAVDDRNRTRMHYAAEQGCKKVAAVLIKLGIDLNVKSKGNRTARDIASDPKTSHPDIVDMIEKAPPKIAANLNDDNLFEKERPTSLVGSLVDSLLSKLDLTPTLITNMPDDSDSD